MGGKEGKATKGIIEVRRKGRGRKGEIENGKGLKEREGVEEKGRDDRTQNFKM